MNISSVVKNNLCVSCGLCAGVCPKNCISSIFKSGSYLPNIDENSCINCGFCYQICPGKSADYVTPYENAPTDIFFGVPCDFGYQFCPGKSADYVTPYENAPTDIFFGVPCDFCHKVCSDKSADYVTPYENTPTDIFFGVAKKCLAVQTKDKEILKQSSSGGVVTTIVKNLLRDKIYDAAFLVDTYNHDAEIFTNIYTADSNFTNTPKSRYLTVNQSRAVQFMLKNRDKKLILVGTSCFIQGILNVIHNFSLNRENYFLAGLFCDKTMHYNVWKYFKVLANADTLFFRTKEQKGWPGVVGVENNGKKIFLPRKIRMRMKDFFSPNVAFIASINSTNLRIFLLATTTPKSRCLNP